jgi:L-alanine-DL-glutamate epimerase-like enolase superfamily enzyme
VAALAEQHAVMIAPHTAPELHAHLVAALPRCGFGVESHGDTARNSLSHHLLVDGAETRDSFVHLNDTPGFGMEINWGYAKRMPPDHGTSGAGEGDHEVNRHELRRLPCSESTRSKC